VPGIKNEVLSTQLATSYLQFPHIIFTLLLLHLLKHEPYLIAISLSVSSNLSVLESSEKSVEFALVWSVAEWYVAVLIHTGAAV